jgi:predicted AAA+ superfamily ATPase
MGILTACTPRAEVLKGDLEDAIFAADFGQLVSGTSPRVYGNAQQFFRNTHPAEQLKRIVEAVFARLNAPEEAGATIRLSTGFGGGKTHTLMALWHLARSITDFSLGTELLPAAGRPSAVTVAGIDAGQAGVPNFATRDGHRIKSLAGAIAFDLKGQHGLDALGEADTIGGSPNESEIRSLFPDGPVLILIDELVVYMAQLNAEQQGNLMGFVKRLMSVVQARPQTALVVTDPAAQPAYAAQASVLAKQFQGALKLDNIYGRSMSDFDPIKQEGAKVIARRLFESIDPTAAQSASASYADLYRHASETPNLLPKEAADPEYAKRLVECYPFHPRLLDTAQDRLGALSEFNKSRGVLRLFARIVRDVWERNEDVELVTAGDIDWTSARIQADLLDRLDRQNFRAAVSADVDGHAGELDGDAERGVHRRVASAVLLESIPLEPNSALNKPELTLATLRPNEAGHEPSEAMDNLMKVCWHTYVTDDGQAYQFRYHPNVNKQIEERMATVKLDEAEDRVRSQVQKYFSGPVFSLV